MKFYRQSFGMAAGAFLAVLPASAKAEGLYADCISDDKTRSAYTFIDRGNHTGTDRQSLFLSENPDGFVNADPEEHSEHFVFNSLQHMPLDLVAETMAAFCKAGTIPSHQGLSTDPEFGVDTEIAHCKKDDRSLTFHNDPVNKIYFLTYQFGDADPITIGRNEGLVLNQQQSSDAIRDFCASGVLPIPLIN